MLWCHSLLCLSPFLTNLSPSLSPPPFIFLVQMSPMRTKVHSFSNEEMGRGLRSITSHKGRRTHCCSVTTEWKSHLLLHFLPPLQNNVHWISAQGETIVCPKYDPHLGGKPRVGRSFSDLGRTSLCRNQSGAEVSPLRAAPPLSTTLTLSKKKKCNSNCPWTVKMCFHSFCYQLIGGSSKYMLIDIVQKVN